MYSASKAALSHLSNSIKFNEDKKCRITDINVGLLQSDLPSLKYQEIADWIIHIMNKGAWVEIGELSMWHRDSYVNVQQQKQLKLNESMKNMGKN